MKFLTTASALVAGLAAVSGEVLFKETFDDKWADRWVASNWKKGEGQGAFKLSAGKWYGDAEADKGLQTSEDARFYASSAKFPSFSNKGKDLVIQFSVKHEQGIDCGGGYVKVFPASLDQKEMTGDSEYNIMFGPDICGSDTKRIHVIFNYKGENKLIKHTIPAETDDLTHVYTLIVSPDNTYEVRVDGEMKRDGSLEDDWDFLAPKQIKDPDQSKPADWVDASMMDDPEDVKPEGYDDIEEQVVDPDAEKPDDWDDESDGEWEAPMVDNPDYKGPWRAKRIENPDYKGPWVHPMIENPEYEADDQLYAYDSFGVIGLDLWQVKAGSIFDNIIITDNVDEATAFMSETYGATIEGEKKMRDEVQEAERKAQDAEREKMEAERKAAEDEEEDDEEDEEDEAPVKAEL